MTIPIGFVRRLFVLGCAVVTPAWLTACGTTTPQLDAVFGQAVRQARAAQTLNPQAGEVSDPVLGIDGKAAVAAQERYQDAFRTPPRTFETTRIGGSITGD
jgi:hypothetical protein